MTLRFCPRCSTEVEDAGGYCLLGHPLRLVPPVSSLSDLRAEVDRVFEEARDAVSAAVSPALSQGPAGRSANAPPPPPSGPPPPPPPADGRPHDGRAVGAGVWKALHEGGAPALGDPIVAFAPAPRMDWGPGRLSFLKRVRQRDGSNGAA